MALLEIDRLTYSVAERTLLNNLSLSLEAGEIHALVGANGSGKSTLAYLVMGCEGYRPTSGSMRFHGACIDALPLFERARKGIALAWQEPARFEGLSVHDYLCLGSGNVDKRDCLTRVGMTPEDYLYRRVDKTLSGGERKRIELASVLALNPRLVMLDEPTAGIDLLSIPEIIGLIRAFKVRGTAVLLITHREEVTRIADRASLLSHGRIECCGIPERVAENYRQKSQRARQ